MIVVRRSIRAGTNSLHSIQRRLTTELKPLQNDPIPFDIQEHGPRFQAQMTDDKCTPNKTRYVLFMLDTSASISTDEFRKMTHQVSRLAFYFCGAMKVAVMTFNHMYSVEFCFDCFRSDCEGRQDMRDTMRNITYRGGHTYTAGAAQCACNFILSADCGFVEQDACIDVVVITDGQSNDPFLDVCNEITCMKNTSLFPDAQINVFVFGISDFVNRKELECLTRLSIEPLPHHIFNFNDFDDFDEQLDLVIKGLKYSSISCIDPPVFEGYTLDCREFDDD